MENVSKRISSDSTDHRRFQQWVQSDVFGKL